MAQFSAIIGAVRHMDEFEESPYAYLLAKRKDRGKGPFSLREALSETLKKEDEGGIAIGDRLIANRVAWLAEHPDRVDLKELSSALGESRQSVDVTSDGDALAFFAPPTGRGGDEG